jgi:hypothetical protein
MKYMKKKFLLIIYLLIIIILVIPLSNAIQTNVDVKKILLRNINKEQKKYAIFIATGSEIRDQNNIDDFIEVLTKHGWDERNILKITNKNASKNAILSIPFFWLNDQGANEDDIVLFFFSLHGSNTKDREPFDEPDDRDEFIVPYNSNFSNVSTMIRDDELNPKFNSIKSKNQIIIFESCCSGGMIDGDFDLRKSNRIIITSCSTNESSYPILLHRRWLFPFYLTKGLKGPADFNKDGWISAEEIFKYAEKPTILRSAILGSFLFIFHKTLLIQHPLIYDGWPSEQDNFEELKLITTKID